MTSAFPSFTRALASDLSQAAVVREFSVPRRSLLGRLLDALIEPRRRNAERQFARLIERSGGRLTDNIEREAERCAAGLR